jgi:hypothetical protein
MDSSHLAGSLIAVIWLRSLNKQASNDETGTFSEPQGERHRAPLFTVSPDEFLEALAKELHWQPRFISVELPTIAKLPRPTRSQSASQIRSIDSTT